MEKNRKRAERRAHYFRLKNKRKKYHGYDPTIKESVESTIFSRFIVQLTDKEAQGILGMRVSTPQMCSCISCGNPRKHIRSLITLQEHIALYTYADGIEEVFGWRPRINKYTKWW